MVETTVNLVNKYNNERTKLNKINDAILAITLLCIIVSVIVMSVFVITNDGIAENGDVILSGDVVIDLILFPLFGFLALAGVISVVASNNKAPLMLLAFSLVSTLFKLMYPITQVISGSSEYGGINSTVILGQMLSFILIFAQAFFWMRWNKETDEGKFITESFKGRRTFIAIGIIIAWICLNTALSIYFNGGNILFIAIDIFQASMFTIASVLMAFGNIFCFVFFLISDISWLVYTITDMINTDSGLMFLVALMTTWQVLAYTLLAFTGFFQWFSDDFEYIEGKIKRKERSI